MSMRSPAGTPCIVDLKPGGRYVAKDLFEAGGIPLLMKTLLDNGFLHGDCLTVSGRSIAENLAKVAWNDQQDVVAARPSADHGDRRRRRPQGQPRARRRDREGRRHGSRAFDLRPGTRVRQRGSLLRSRRNRNYKEGEVLVIRYEGPKGGPGMREMLSTTAALYGQGMGDKVALITDGRFSGRDPRLLRRPCRAGGGGGRADRAVAGRRHHRDRRDRGPVSPRCRSRR